MDEIFDFLSIHEPENFVPKAKPFSVTELDKLPLAMAYVPLQKIKSTYEKDEALMSGTLFPELDKKFYGKKCK